MSKYLRSSFPYLISIFLFFYCWNVYWGGKRWDGFFLSDSGGYYGYLPAAVIYDDFNFSFIEGIQRDKFNNREGYDFRSDYFGKKIDKWYCGTAVAIAPFFLLSHTVSLLKGDTADGYSIWYAWGLNIAAIFYCLAGLLALQKILRHFFHSQSLVNLLLILAVFATNLFYYATSEPAMSHVYSFAFVNLFVLAAIRMVESNGQKNIMLCAVLLGMIVLIRPVNGLIIFLIPFLSGSQQKLKLLMKGLLMQGRKMLPAALLFSAIIFIQLAVYKLQTGQWFIYSYGNESMDLFSPHLKDFLFSYKKGLFVYLPITFLSLSGFYFLFRKDRFRCWSLAFFILGMWYILSCWWNWWYGGALEPDR